MPNDREGLLAWTEVNQRMEQARVYWVSTVDPASRPHATPVDGLWRDNLLYFGGSPQTRRNRNLEGNPAVCVHLESGSEVVILHGEARLTQADEPLAHWLAEATTAKYGYPSRPEEYQASGVHVFRPSHAFAWKRFPTDATRYRFGPASDRDA